MAPEPLPDGAMRSVEARGIYKEYGRQRALADVSLTLRAGQITALLGENGAGKSTLMGILATLVRPSRGEVRYDDRRAEDWEPQRLRSQLGVLSHEPRCYTDLTPRENLRFFGRLYGIAADARGIAQLVDQQLDKVDLMRAADRPTRTLSRGMLQRLALARTLLPRPSLLLLDEPYTGLDRGGVELLSSLLLAERARGATLLVISHDLDVLAPLCDQVAVLVRGRLARLEELQVGTGTGARLNALYREAQAARAAGLAKNRGPQTQMQPEAQPEPRP